MLLLVGCWLIASGPCPAAESPPRRPNVVVILADDLGYGDVGCYHPDGCRIPTPRLDALAGQGIRFTDGHSAAASCTASRYAILTGRYPWRTRLQRGILELWEPPLIAADRLTLAGLAARHGYHTACVGKWHLGWKWPIAAEDAALFRDLGGRSGGKTVVATASPAHLAAWRRTFELPIADGPTTRGFTEFFGIDLPNWPPFCFIENDRLRDIPTALLPPEQVRSDGLMATAQGPAVPDWRLDDVLPSLVDRACGIVAEQSRQQRPFLLYVPLTSPHTPIAVSPEWQGRSGLGVPYADFVMQTDAAVGRILDAIDAAGCAADTLVVFTSDNGCETKIGLEQLARQGHHPSGPFRGFKRDAWEGGHRVPFIVRWPSVVTPGRTSDAVVGSIDLMATLADILDDPLPPNAGEDSVSLMPLLRAAEGPAREALVHQSNSGVLAIRSGRWKLICGPGSGDPDGSPERLYDLAADPGETRDIAAEQPAEVERLGELLKRYVVQGRSTAGPAQANDVPVRIRKEPVGGSKAAPPKAVGGA